jgi:hypothetical protein
LIITCLWRSLYFLSAEFPQHRIRRVCPSIFNCQRPQKSKRTTTSPRMRNWELTIEH